MFVLAPHKGLRLKRCQSRCAGRAPIVSSPRTQALQPQRRGAGRSAFQEGPWSGKRGRQTRSAATVGLAPPRSCRHDREVLADTAWPTPVGGLQGGGRPDACA
eukprot:scaffold873_cov393-Prasinococcus_capsulatus_cf.AAC.20